MIQITAYVEVLIGGLNVDKFVIMQHAEIKFFYFRLV
jgi:hypothetical protein